MTVKPIFGNPKVLEGNPMRFSVLNNLVTLTTRLVCQITDAEFVKNDDLEIVSDSADAVSKIMNWHLFKSGLKLPEFDN